MTMVKKVKDERTELQTQISRYISIGKDYLTFKLEKKKGRFALQLITYNPNHEQSFLFHSTLADSELEAYRQMLKYVKFHKEEESSYTIQWMIIGENQLHTSYFRASNILGALDKLYFKRDPNSITVFSVMLNPIS
jgi:hypothetical protein